MPEAAAQELLIAIEEAVNERVPDLLLPPEHRGAGAWHHRQGHHQGGHQAEGDGPGHVGQERPHHAAGKDHGEEDADRGKGGGEDGRRHLPGPLDGGSWGRDAPVPQPVDVLNDHHRVIHQHADTQGQA